MAVLRKQRLLLQVLKELENEGIYNTQVGSSMVEMVAYIGNGHHYIYENTLILRILGEEKFNQERITEFKEWKRVLDASISCGLVDWIKNDHYMTKEPGYRELMLEHEILSKKLVEVNRDKGEEMIDNWHYWLSRVPEAFPQPAQIAVSVLISVITATLTTVGVLLIQ